MPCCITGHVKYPAREIAAPVATERRRPPVDHSARSERRALMARIMVRLQMLGLTLREIGEVWNVTPAAVCKRLARAARV